MNALEMVFMDIYYSVDFSLVMYFLKGPRFHMPADGVHIWTLVNSVGKNFQVPLKSHVSKSVGK